MRMGRVLRRSRAERQQHQQQRRLLLERGADVSGVGMGSGAGASAPCVPRTLSLFCTSSLVLCHSDRLSQSQGDLALQRLTVLSEEEEEEEDEDEGGFRRPPRHICRGKLDARHGRGCGGDRGKGVCGCVCVYPIN